MNLRPLRDQVLIKLASEETVTPGGIYLPPMAQGKEPVLKGTVTAVGAGADEKHPISVSVGNEVFFVKHTGQEIKIDGEEYRLVKEDWILGVVEE